MPPKDSEPKPMRIREPRGAAAGAPRRKTGKQRDPVLKQRRTAVYGKRQIARETLSDTASQFSTLRTRKRRRRDVPRSPLEDLPAEVVQLIFEYSANVELPLISTALARKLRQSPYLQRQLSDRLLDPVLGFEDSPGAATADALAHATRLLNSRFMTFDFFRSWLRARSGIPSITGNDPTDHAAPSPPMLWSALRPSLGLLPPGKLLRPPFTSDKVNFLKVFASHVDDIANQDAAYGELAHEGLMAAVQLRRSDLVLIFFQMGLRSSTELLRVAVTEAGCDEHLVRLLAGDPGTEAMAQVSPPRDIRQADVDLLDPTLWAWAEKARTHGNDKGDWLVAFLRETQRRKDSLHAEEHQATT